MFQAPELPHDLLIVTKTESVAARLLRLVAANQLEAPVANGALAVGHFVDAIARAVDVLPRLAAQNRKLAAMHEAGHLCASQREQRRREIHEAHEPRVDIARLDVRRSVRLGPTDDHRHLQTGVVELALRARETIAVIRRPDHDGRVSKTVGLELHEQLADLAVHGMDVVVEPREVLAHEWRVRVVRRQQDVFGQHRAWLRRQAVGARAHQLHHEVHDTMRPGPQRAEDTALVGHVEVHHPEKWLTSRTAAPRRHIGVAVEPEGSAELLIPDREGPAPWKRAVAELVIELLGDKREISCSPQQLRKRLHIGRRNGRIAPLGPAEGAHVLAADRDLVHARDQRRAARRANSGAGESVRVAHALGRKRVEIRGHGDRITEGADPRTQVFGDQQQ